jgi:hypothetical protein
MTTTSPSQRTIDVFLSCATTDRDDCAELLQHLALLQSQGLIRLWHDQMVALGANRTEEVYARLQAADVVLILVTKNYLSSPLCFEVELKHAMERHCRGLATVIPVLVSPCDIADAPFAALEPVPSDRTFIASSAHRDLAWAEVSQRLRRLIAQSEVARSPLRWRSTTESAWNGELSVLAIFETFVAMFGALWIAYRFRTLTHVLIAISLVPLAMLRTEASMRLAIRWWLSAVGWINRGSYETPEQETDFANVHKSAAVLGPQRDLSK